MVSELNVPLLKEMDLEKLREDSRAQYYGNLGEIKETNLIVDYFNGAVVGQRKQN